MRVMLKLHKFGYSKYLERGVTHTHSIVLQLKLVDGHSIESEMETRDK